MTAAPGAVPLVPGAAGPTATVSEVSYFGHDCAVRLQLAGHRRAGDLADGGGGRARTRARSWPSACAARSASSPQRRRPHRRPHRRRLPPRRADRGPDPASTRIRAWATHAFPGLVASGVVEVRSDLDGLDRGGFWAVVVTFEGTVTCVRFANVTVTTCRLAGAPGSRAVPGRRRWAGSGLGLAELPGRAGLPCGRGGHPPADRRRAGLPGQPLPRAASTGCPRRADLHGLYDVLAEGNPAPYACLVDVPEAGSRGGQRLARAVPASQRRPGGVAPDQGDRRGPRRRCCPRTTPRTS